jgi:hypothetical protein
MAKVDPLALPLPVPSALVFHPAKKKPAFTRSPVLPSTVTLAFCWYDPVSLGTLPPVALLASYFTV